MRGDRFELGLIMKQLLERSILHQILLDLLKTCWKAIFSGRRHSTTTNMCSKTGLFAYVKIPLAHDNLFHHQT